MPEVGEKRFISVTLELEYTQEDYFDEDEMSLELVAMRRSTDMSDNEIDSLGERIGQSDKWQVTHWNHIQSLLGNSSVARVNY